MKCKAEDSFMIRIPIFSSSYLKNRMQIKALFDNEIFLEGIQIASPDLYQRIQEMKQKNISIDENPKVVNSLYKYAIRATSRTTPFGLFCGFCMGSFAKETNMVVDDRNTYSKRARSDMEWINEIICELENNKEIFSSIKIYSNTSLYQKGNFETVNLTVYCRKLVCN